MAKILIVDDDVEDLEVIKTILIKDGHETVEAGDGAEALDLIKQNEFEMILIDIQMPTLSGYDLLRLMRESLNHKVKMVYVTIVPKEEVNMEDIDGFVQKPFSPESLSSEVKRVLGN